MPGYEYCDTSTDDVEPDLLLLESPLEALEVQITSADLHLEMLILLIPVVIMRQLLFWILIFEPWIGLGLELCGLYRQLPCGLCQLITVFYSMLMHI